MKTKTQLLTILLLLFFFNHFAFANEISDIKDVFPKVEQLKGGSSSWIISGVTEETRDACKMYENTYTYYSTKSETIMDIQRKNSYMVSVRIYSCDNFLSAFNTFDELSQVEKDYDGEKRTAPAPFGERGSLFALPNPDSQYMADFYLTYIMRTFVVQVYSDDGFAQMDMAGVIEQGLLNIVKQQGNAYFINKINLDTVYKDERYTSVVSFTGDNITTVILDGIVYDKNNVSVPNIKLTARETGQSFTTDENGRYSIEITAGSGDVISLTKMVFLPVAVQQVSSPLPTGVYEVSTDKSPYMINMIETDDVIIGKMFDVQRQLTYDITGTIKDDDAVRIIANCARPNSSIRCAIVFSGNVQANGTIVGKYTGADKGDWIIDKTKIAPIVEQKYLQDTNVMLIPSVFSGGKFEKSNSNTYKLESSPQANSFIRIVTNSDKSDLFYFKSAKLMFDVKFARGSAKIGMYEIVENGEGVALKKVRDIATIDEKSVGEMLTVDITAEYRLPAQYGYLLAVDGADVVLEPITAPVEIEYFRDAQSYKPKQLFNASVKTFDGKNRASNSNAVKPDNMNDIELSLSISAKGRSFEYIEISTVGEVNRRWNTNRFDIFPLVVVSQDDKILNDNNGDIAIKLDDNEEVFTLSLYKGTLVQDEVTQLLVKIILDGKIYESVIDVSK